MKIALYIFCVFASLTLISSINLDARFSLIKEGAPKSYFGFSVAQHQTVEDPLDLTSDVKENLLFVGAPNTKSRVGSRQVGGALYTCKATSLDDCEQIKDIYTKDRKISDSENLETQWLGVTVASSGKGGQLVGCAHRYTIDNAALGTCYISSVEEAPNWVKRTPCSSEKHNNYHKDFGLCQAGMSATVGQYGTFLMGAPGSVFWQGVTFLANVSEDWGVSQTENVSPYIQKKYPNTDGQITPTSSYSYNGYAVAMGRFDKKNMYYASGAPRSKVNGQVILYTSPKLEYNKEFLKYNKKQILTGEKEFSGFGTSLLALDINNDGVDDLIVGAPYYYKKNTGGAFYVYLGEDQSGKKFQGKRKTEVLSRKMSSKDCEELKCEHARFGISLSKLGDLNMDGYQDFAVGAPYEGNGAVYIYHGDNSEAGFKTDYIQRITAKDLPGNLLKSFGYSLSGGLDLDFNGYPDLLVGAYESDSVVLVRSRPIIKLFSDVTISPKSIDMSNKASCSEFPDEKRHCLKIRLCITYQTPKESFKKLPIVLYDLEAENQRTTSRVELHGAKDGQKKKLENKELKLKKSSRSCIDEFAFLKSKIDDKFNDVEFTFKFKLDLKEDKMEDYPDSAIQDVNIFPVLDTDGSAVDTNSVIASAEFLKECGDDNECDSNLQFYAELHNLNKTADGNYELIVKRDNELEVTMEVSNIGEAAYATTVYVQKPKGVSYIGTVSKDGVTCQSYKDDTIPIKCNQIGNPLKKKKVKFTLKLSVSDTLGDTLVDNANLYNITAWVNTTSTEKTPANDKHVLKFRVINKANIYVQSNVFPEYPIIVQGETRDKNDIKIEREIGDAVEHVFIVRNQGPGVITKSYITIYWPYETLGEDDEPGKPLLYLTRPPSKNEAVIKCNDGNIQQYINPFSIETISEVQVAQELREYSVPDDSGDPDDSDDPDGVDEIKNLPDTQDGLSRRKRSTSGKRGKRATGDVVSLSCEDGKAKCFQYKCEIGKLEPRKNYAEIRMRTRLWESTLLSDFSKSMEVQIISFANVTISSDLKITQAIYDDDTRAYTKVVFKEITGQPLDWWIILVAVLVGLLLLLLVIFILYKCGFFKRKRQEDMQMYKAEKNKQGMLTEYDEDNF